VPHTVDELSGEIRRYCAAHPNAADTIEGIAWWLALQRYDDALQEVRNAVDQLVGEGVLVRYQKDGVPVFGCRRLGMERSGS
jgi:hypothetical protein